jgi:hypothetical protein
MELTAWEKTLCFSASVSKYQNIYTLTVFQLSLSEHRQNEFDSSSATPVPRSTLKNYEFQPDG